MEDMDAFQINGINRYRNMNAYKLIIQSSECKNEICEGSIEYNRVILGCKYNWDLRKIPTESNSIFCTI